MQTVTHCFRCQRKIAVFLLQFGKIATLSAVASSWMFTGNAQAAAELATVAAADNRLSVIGLLFLPALGWVAFNIFQPALNQLARQSEIKEDASGSSAPRAPRKAPKKKRGVAGAVGLGAALSLFAAQQADAATEIAQLAAGDNRWVTAGSTSCGPCCSSTAYRACCSCS